jgi:ATP-dependent DNA ligase
MPPVSPMLARAANELPLGDGWLYEPKWDGFRCVVFRDGEEVVLGSRNERPLTRYFPDLLAPLRACLPSRCVLDAELVVPGERGLDFDALQQRIHPAESRVKRLSEETPASFVAFDLLALDDTSLMDTPLRDRRALLEKALAGAQAPIHLTPMTRDRTLAEDWFVRFEGAGLDGIMAKPGEGVYEPGKRVQFKVKHRRSADCVVAGYRMHKDGEGVGSLLLGLYDPDERLHHVGVASSFTARRRKELLGEVSLYLVDDLADHPWGEWASQANLTDLARMPGAVSRWNAKKDLSFTPLRPELVAEVAFEQVQNGRFRHSARLLRWRPDRTAESCTYGQLDETPPYELAQIFS